MDSLINDFIIECSEGLAKLDQDLVVLEKNPADAEVLKVIFRVLHSVKGTGGMLGLSRLEKVAHAAEDVLGSIRDGELSVSSQVIGCVLCAVDSIKNIMSALETTGEEPAGNDDQVIADLRALLEKKAETEKNVVNLNPPRPEQPSESAHADDGKGGRSMAEQSLRVHLDVLDRLMNLVGELVLTRNQLTQLVRGDDESKYLGPIQQLNRITSGLQESVMRTRMQPIGNAWAKLPRIVRDLTASSGKQIELIMNGQETEIDRQVLQAIQDPLVHCVRNSADHGLESAEERKTKNKPSAGKISLNAFHEGGHIIIEIKDDGRGIDLGKVKASALKKGLVQEEDAGRLTEQQILNLIFEPGFSTAEKVTEISGRGVGMDVVRTNIEQIGGAVEIHSRLDLGTTVRIKIPLTLAIISALIVKVGKGKGETFAIPQVGVVELVRISESNHHLIERINTSHVLRLRDKLLPLVDLGGFLGHQKTEEQTEFSIVVAQVNSFQFGLVVTEIFDTQEIVVKPIGRALREVNLFAGSTILGDGRVIIILDLARIATRTGLLKSAPGEDDSDSQSEESAQVGSETATLLLFRVGDHAPMAVPLALVTRLEEFKSSAIEKVEDRFVVQYRERLLPLLSLDDAAVDSKSATSVPTIIFSEGDRAMGLAVTEVTDIVEASLNVESAGQKKGVLGSTIIRGRATELIDVNHHLQKAYPNWFASNRGKTPENAKRILFAEDSIFFQNLIRPVLESCGYQVVVASDGARALEELAAGARPDIILSDIEMPNVDGYELAKAVRRDNRWCQLPIVAMTSLSSESAKTKAIASGFNEFLTKFDKEILLATIEKYVRAPQEMPEERAV
jgi:two-component system chemotaxis sensor kinase CheA